MAYNTKRIALIGILGALTVISLLLAVILPTTKLSLYALSSFFVSIIIIEYKTPAGWVFYITTNLLAYIVIPDKLGLIPYTVFFGMYGIIKYYSEKVNKTVIGFILKYIYFNICLVFALFLANQFFPDIFFSINKLKYPIWLIVIILQLIFFIYDYAYTMIINYYKNRLRKHLKV